MPQDTEPDDEPATRPTPRSTFFQMNFPQLLTVGTVALGMLWTIFGYGRDIADNKEAIALVVKQVQQVSDRQDRRIEALEVYLKNVDRDGTQYGRGKMDNQQRDRDATEKRVERLEDSINKLQPKIEKMDTNLEWISGWVKVQAQQPAGKTK